MTVVGRDDREGDDVVTISPGACDGKKGKGRCGKGEILLSEDAAKKPFEAAGLRGVIPCAGAPLLGGDGGFDGIDVVAASGPGCLPAALAVDGSAHSVLLRFNTLGGIWLVA